MNSVQGSTVKPLLSGTSIKRTPSRVPKLTSHISLYNEPLLSRHLSGRGHLNKLYLANFYCLKPLYGGYRTKLTKQQYWITSLKYKICLALSAFILNLRKCKCPVFMMQYLLAKKFGTFQILPLHVRIVSNLLTMAYGSDLTRVCAFRFAETTPQFKSEEVTSPENRNISLQLAVRALDKQRAPANVSVSIIKGLYYVEESRLMKFNCTHSYPRLVKYLQ